MFGSFKTNLYICLMDYKETLISKLKANPSNDKEIGYNTAIIEILQGFQKEELPPLGKLQKLRFAVYREYLKFYSEYSQSQLLELDGYLINRNKLDAVKLHKDISGDGLKESKDNIDLLWDKIQLFL